MSKTIRRILLCVPVLTVLGVMTAAAAVRADDPPNLEDYNTAWQYAEGPAQPDPNDGATAYWQEVQTKQLADPGQ